MLTRRDVLLGAIAAGIVRRTGTVAAKASQPATSVNFEVPLGACDCHTHIHGDPAKFPFFAGRVYTPEMAPPEEMATLHKALHVVLPKKVACELRTLHADREVPGQIDRKHDCEKTAPGAP